MPDMDFTLPTVDFPAIDLPEAPKNTLDFSALDNITLPAIDEFHALDITNYVPDAAPAFDGVAPIINDIDTPSSIADFTESAPQLDDLVVPDQPSFADIVMPNLESIIIPDLPSLKEIEFDGASPSFDLEPPDVEFQWNEINTQPQLDALATRLESLLALDTDGAEQAIWERGQERLERTIEEQSRALFDDFVQRGFSLPNGVLVNAQMELRSKGIDQKADNARDAMIKAADLVMSKLTLAIQNGVQYQGLWFDYQSKIAQRALDAQVQLGNLSYQFFAASVAIFNAKIEKYKADAEVYRDKIQGEMAKVETYKAQIDGQRAIGEINSQLVQMYVAQHQALTAKADVYRSIVGGIEAKANIERSKIEAFKAKVEAYGERVRAYTAEYAAYGEQVKAQVAKVGVFDAQVKAFTSQVQAYESGERTKQQAAMVDIERARATAQEYEAKIQGIATITSQALAMIQRASVMIEAQAKAFSAEASVYGETARVEIARAETIGRESISVAELALRKAQVIADTSLRASGIQMQALDAAGRTAAQLAGSAMAAVNVHAQMSSSSNLSLSNGLHESWSGTIPTPVTT